MPIYKDHSFRSGASAAAGADSVYEISQSIRFNDNDTTYMSRTPSSASNRKTWTWSAWCKRGHITDSDNGNMFCTYGGGSAFSGIRWETTTQNDTLFIFDFNGSSFGYQLHTTQVFRDPSAWYHIVFAFDSTQSVSSERARLYISGQRVTDFRTESYPTLNYDSYTNNNQLTVIGASNSGSYNEHLDGYLAEIIFLDGYAYGPEYFGTTNSSGIWIPIDYDTETGNYGTNGFYIDGRDSADLGDDESGNGNDFTTSGLAAHDQVTDTPNNNFCTYNSTQLQSGATLSNGDLDAVSSGSSWRNVHSTIGVSSGKWYWEVKADVINSTESWIAGIQETSFVSKSNYWWQSGYTASSSGIVFGVLDNNNKVTNTTKTSFTHDIAQGDIVQFQLNLDDNELTVLVDGVSKGKIYDITADTEYTPAVCLYNTSSATINFGQDGTFAGTETAGGNSDGNGVGNFKHSVPSGYLALCTKGLGS